MRNVTTKNKHKSILDMDATCIADNIKSGELTSYEATQSYIDHIKKVNPKLNAMIQNRFTIALNEAKLLDEKVTTPKGPLHGVPISIKESYDVAGMKTTGGLIHRQDLIEKKDAEIVRKLKAAGAIILGKTNTPALCFCQETDNKLYGRTNNPWDISRTTGGSSGGEGALLAVGGAAAGLGSDIGGSIRFPSHFNGIVGFKPGMYQVSQQGHFPHISIPLQERMLGFGPMGKSVRDISLLYNVIAKNVPTNQSLNTYEVNIVPTDTTYPLTIKTKEMIMQIKVFLQDILPTKQVTPPYFEESALLWQEMMSVDGGESIKDMAFTSDRTSALSEYIKEKTTGKSQLHTYLSWAIIGANLFKPSKKRIREIEAIIEEGDGIIGGYLKNRLIIFPVYHRGALEHGKLYKEIFSIRKTFLEYLPYIAYANVWGLPSLTVPVGTDENNMPIGVQIMSMNGNESALFKLGAVLERKFGGYQRCTKLD